MQKGLFILLVGPPGVGKTTIAQELLARNLAWARLITSTSRNPRIREDGLMEVNGEDYFFLSKEEFQSQVKQGDFLEWMNNYGNLYGSSRPRMESQLERHPFVLGIIDVKGATEIKKIRPETVVIFIEPEDKAQCTERILARGGLDPVEQERRVENIDTELALKDSYDQLVTNRDGDIEYVLSSIEKILSDL